MLDGWVQTDDQAKTLSRETGAIVEVGEPLEPCQPAGVLAEILAATGRPCPRIELQPANSDSWQLFTLIIRDDARAMFGSFFDALTAGRSATYRSALIRRVLGTLNSPDVHAIMHPDPKR